jgi:hypothetical protein
MWYSLLADVVLLLHLGFVLFVVLGGFLALRWRRLAYIHIPVAIYGIVIEVIGFVCPLTPLEIWLRRQGGGAGYEGGFVEHYITAALYPSGLTRAIQLALAALLLIINAAAYTLWWRRRRRWLGRIIS